MMHECKVVKRQLFYCRNTRFKSCKPFALCQDRLRIMNARRVTQALPRSGFTVENELRGPRLS